MTCRSGYHRCTYVKVDLSQGCIGRVNGVVGNGSKSVGVHVVVEYLQSPRSALSSCSVAASMFCNKAGVGDQTGGQRTRRAFAEKLGCYQQHVRVHRCQSLVGRRSRHTPR